MIIILFFVSKQKGASELRGSLGGWGRFKEASSYPRGFPRGVQPNPPLEELQAEIEQLASVALAIPAADIAVEAGDSRAATIALLGAFSQLSAAPLSGEDLEKILAQRFKGKVLELNRKAFAMGREAAKKGGAV